MPLSDYAAAAILNSLHGKSSNFGALASVPTIYLALCTAAPTPASTGTTITEATYIGYARVATAASDWGSASGRITANAVAKNFATATAGSSTVTHIARCDALTVGNLIDYAPIMLAQSITTLTRSSTTATCVITGHGYSTGDAILITGAEQPEYDGFKIITVSDANTFTYTIANSPATTATAESGQSLQGWKATSLAVSVNIQPQFAIGSILIPLN